MFIGVSQQSVTMVHAKNITSTQTNLGVCFHLFNYAAETLWDWGNRRLASVPSCQFPQHMSWNFFKVETVFGVIRLSKILRSAEPLARCAYFL